MIRHTYYRAIGYFKVVGGNGHALFGQAADFFLQVVQVDDHARAHYVYHALAQYAGGQQIQYEFAALVYYGMAGVVATLITNYDVIISAQQIDHAALAFVAPVYAGDCG